MLARTEARLDEDLDGCVRTLSAVAAEGVGEVQSALVAQQRQAAEPIDLSTSPGVVGMLLHPLVVQLDAVRRVAVVCFVNASSSSHGGSLRSVVKGHSYYSTFYIIMQLACDWNSGTVDSMKEFASSNGTVIVVNRGEEVTTRLTEYARQHNLTAAWVSGLGGAGTATLGFYDIEAKDYEWRQYNTPLEILNLTGNLAIIDDEPFWHIHGTFGTRDYQAIGGHVKELVVGLTCELLVTPLDTPLTRTFDDETGLKLL